MSKDTIYRQDAMNAFDCSIGGVPVESVKYVSEYADKMMSRINALPSAEPERKTGKLEIYIISMLDGEGCKCSECGFEGAPYWDYCPNCGSYNGGEQDG